LAIFHDGFVLDAANAVAGESADVFDGVASLLNKSLLSAVGAIGGEPRFGMLETIREYALEQLVIVGEADEIRHRHAAWCLALAERAEPALFHGPYQPRWLTRLAAESANLRAALAALLDTDPEAGLRLAAALPRFWFIRGRLSEGRNWLELALAATDGAASRLRAKAWADLCQLASFQEDFARAGEAGEEAERLSGTAGDPWSRAYSQGIRGYQALLQKNFSDAIERADASLALWANLAEDDRSTVARHCLATAAYALGRWDESARLAEDCLAHAHRIGDDFGVALALHRAGSVAFVLGDHASALNRFADSLHRFADLGTGWTAAYALDGVAAVAGAYASDDQTARLLGAAAHQRESAGVSLAGPLRVAHDQAVAKVRASLSGPAFAAAWTAGEALSLEAALAEADHLSATIERPPTAPRPRPPEVTAREADVLRLAVAGLTGPQIADRLFLSPRTVQTHMAAIYRKLDVNTRGEAVRLAIERGLV
jgi:non-specific serine/threonine protein kinase